jgi:hypothetical protein
MDLMQAAKDRDTLPPADVSQQVQDILAGLRIEAGHGFVREDDAWPLRDGSRDRHSLLLAARQSVGSLFRLVQHTDPVEALERPQLILPREASEHPAPNRGVAKASGQHVAERGPTANQIELLKDHSDAAPLTPAEPRRFRSQHADAATGWADKSGDTAEERRFACATRSQYRDELGRTGAERYPADCLAVPVGFSQVLHLQPDWVRRLKSISGR